MRVTKNGRWVKGERGSETEWERGEVKEGEMDGHREWESERERVKGGRKKSWKRRGTEETPSLGSERQTERERERRK